MNEPPAKKLDDIIFDLNGYLPKGERHLSRPWSEVKSQYGLRDKYYLFLKVELGRKSDFLVEYDDIDQSTGEPSNIVFTRKPPSTV
jgi:hypothetical protein